MRNLTLLTDMYELTMVGGYLISGKENQRANFDYFFRKIPDEGGYCIAAGLEQVIDYIKNIRFTSEDLAYLEGLEVFPEKVFRYLEQFHFTGDLFAVPEGTVIFPYEPIIRVTAPLPEAQFIESALLNIMNFQTLIATKASRVCTAAEGDPVIEFGLTARPWSGCRHRGRPGGFYRRRPGYLQCPGRKIVRHTGPRDRSP